MNSPFHTHLLRRLGGIPTTLLAFTALTACSGMDIPNLPAMGSAVSYTRYASSATPLHTLQLGDFNRNMGIQLANYASSLATGGTGYCYNFVARDIHAFLPAFLSGEHAYLAADQLAASPYFKEVSLPASDLPSLPAGAVVVWDKGLSESGHISIADGLGHEVSDHIAPQMTFHYGGGAYRVFLPKP